MLVGPCRTFYYVVTSLANFPTYSEPKQFKMCYENYTKTIQELETSQWYDFNDLYDSVVSSILNKSEVLTCCTALPTVLFSKNLRFPHGNYVCSSYGIWKQLFKSQDFYQTFKALRHRIDILDRFNFEDAFQLRFLNSAADQ